MKKLMEESSDGITVSVGSLDELIQRGAREAVQQAIEAELATWLEQYGNVRTLDGRRAVVRNGYLPEREVVTALGPVLVKVPTVRDRSGAGIKFNSNIVPPYIRKSPHVSAELPWLYLRSVSTGNMSEALGVLLGEQAQGLSSNVACRLKAQWAEEFLMWSRRDLSNTRWVYWWADGIHTALCSDDSDGRLLVIVGVKPDGTKERVAIVEGYRDSKDAWLEVLLDLKARGLQSGPLLASGDGAMGLWAALAEVFPQTRHQRCWFHKIGSVLNVLPKSKQRLARQRLQEIWQAASREDALVAFNRFVDVYSRTYPKAVRRLTDDRDELLSFYDFPTEHWHHLRAINPL